MGSALCSRNGKRLRWYWRNPIDLSSWHIDETYIKAKVRWTYLYRAVDQCGHTIDSYLSARRNSKAATYGHALSQLKREGKCPPDLEHRQIKYKNNLIECDHGKLKRFIKATLEFKSMKTAYATIKGIEVMRALRKG